jgi:hypothetical protein
MDHPLRPTPADALATFSALRSRGVPPGEDVMPPRGVKSPTRKRQYEHIKESAEERGASPRRAKEIAARTVNKQRAESGQAKSSKKASPRKSSSKASGRASGTARKSSGGKKASKKR